MENLRFSALKELRQRSIESKPTSTHRTSDYFGENVFNHQKMRKYLSSEAYKSVMSAISTNSKIDRKMANQIANSMKLWAEEMGATHYTHWFLPLNDATAEKHDAFLDLDKQGIPFENFRGDLLVQQEPDASSFPNGGLRNTFEARGYTAWDPSSPAFILDGTLCIPTIFVSYKGEALDHKTPHLKSLTALDRAATEVCQYFDKEVVKVNVTLGIEQEYFVVDEALYTVRPDIMFTGRTVLGNLSAKDQQLEDHYFGIIPQRVSCFMKDLEQEAYKLGIPLKTRHNEVAPNQFECAPIFEEANLAVDHNQLLMTIMRRIGKRHKLRVLFHEKPFAGVNGSGKHCNWSLVSNTGINLLAPSKTPSNNLQFLTFFVSTIRAIAEYGHLIMSTIATYNNVYRLGGNEAPPAIMSTFLGSTLTEVLNSIVERVGEKKMTPNEKTELKLDIIGKIPEILPDNTDRNRTSPFAFTGNRFEFRAVGSSGNCAAPMLMLNTAMTEQLIRFKNEVDALIEKGKLKKDEAILYVLRKYIIESRDAIFDGNGYSAVWLAEAEKRGLRSINDVPEAIKVLLEPTTVALFHKTNILSKQELEARAEIRFEIYVKKIQIEARVLSDLSRNHVVPAAVRYQNILLENVVSMQNLFPDTYQTMAGHAIKTIKKIAELIQHIEEGINQLDAESKKASKIEDISRKARIYTDNVFPYFQSIRTAADDLEKIIEDQLWTLPKYRELLFLR